MTHIHFEEPKESLPWSANAHRCAEHVLTKLLADLPRECSCDKPYVRAKVGGEWYLGELDNVELSACCIRRLNQATDRIAEDRQARVIANLQQAAIRRAARVRRITKFARA